MGTLPNRACLDLYPTPFTDNLLDDGCSELSVQFIVTPHIFDLSRPYVYETFPCQVGASNLNDGCPHLVSIN